MRFLVSLTADQIAHPVLEFQIGQLKKQQQQINFVLIISIVCQNYPQTVGYSLTIFPSLLIFITCILDFGIY